MKTETENKQDDAPNSSAVRDCPDSAGSASERECQRRYEAERDALNQEHNVITDIAQLDGWRITGLRRWKAGVVQYTAFRKTGSMAEQKIGYAKDEVFADLQIPSQNKQDHARNEGSEG